MVATPGAADAIARARAMPALCVGLHLVLVRGRPVLPPRLIPDLVDRDGALPHNLVRAGFSFFFRPAVRRQLAAEIRAQFERFRDSGLALDHVNTHNHIHLHPTVFALILEIGREFGLRAVRLPHEPFGASWRAIRTGFGRRLAHDWLLRPLLRAHRRRLKRLGIAANDYVFGLNDTGTMDRAHLLGFLANLPDGVSEIYCHPATSTWPEMEQGARTYRVADELAALTDTTVAAALRRYGIEPTGFGALPAPAK